MSTENTGALLFTYGSLLVPDNEFAVYLFNHSSLYANGRIEGDLFDVGEYPGAISRPGINRYVYGRILSLNSAEVLVLIDDYEGFGTEQPQPNEFIRKLVHVETDLAVVECWAYLYSLSVSGLKQIYSGDYLAYRLKK